MKFQKPTSVFWRTVFLSMFVGLFAGALGALAAWSHVVGYQTALIAQGNQRVPVATRGTVLRESNELIEAARLVGARSVADIFQKKSDPIARYLPNEAVGHGIVFSSDGWIISHRSVMEPQQFRQLMVGVDAQLLPIERIIEDQETGVVFAKVAATGLAATVFRGADELQSAGALVVPLNEYKRFVTYVGSPRAREGVYVRSDILTTTLEFTGELSGTLGGAPVLDASGRVVALAIRDTDGLVREAVPARHVVPLFDAVFGDGTLTRPALGVQGVHLSGARSAAGVRERGFLLSTDPVTGRPAVERASAAAVSGLRAGDIILKLNDTLFNGNMDFADALLAFRPGDTVDLTIARLDEEMVITVTLGERDVGKEY